MKSAYDIFISYRRKDAQGSDKGVHIARTIKQYLEIKGYKDGVLVCEDQRTTTGAPKTIRLTLDNEVIANGRDVGRL